MGRFNLENGKIRRLGEGFIFEGRLERKGEMAKWVRGSTRRPRNLAFLTTRCKPTPQ